MLGKLLILLLGEIVAREGGVGEVAVGEVALGKLLLGKLCWGSCCWGSCLGEVVLGKLLLGLSNLVSDSELKSLYSSGRRNVESKY